MFSILVSELTPELLAKAEYWRIFATNDRGEHWSDTRHRRRFDDFTDLTGKAIVVYWGGLKGSRFEFRCFPVTLSSDGTEVRLECPRMPDEPLIENPWFICGRSPMHVVNLDCTQSWYAIAHDGTPSKRQQSPTHEHSPRLTLDGLWVWSTRR